ncbi:RND superfamily putative drug exporter [Nocardioides daedukensis]|uniref:RND superfamily putative drug exporter n=1 Tax=Nocardioides daedukensis TaxID=634462 RepID=A0A7Y9RXJ0_9ACTN|nr:MMPL family transporter [Nocardioides daedukensis]NYG58090.1 RND superfamily putative drug exporter [Nocardioides daedukensis]
MPARNPIPGVAIRAARWSATHPAKAIASWLAMVAFAVGLAFAVPTQTTQDADYRVGESGRAAEMVEDAGLDEPATEVVLITADDLDAQAGLAAADDVRMAMAGLNEVEAVAEPQWNEDRTTLLVAVQLARDQDGESADVGPLRAVTRGVAEDHPGLDIAQTGDASLQEGIGEVISDDLRTAEGISIPVTLVLMLVAFGALIAAGIPVLLALCSVAATIGITAPLSHLIHAEDTVSSMIVLIGMAVGVDYSLFYLKREREERAKGHSTRDAVQIAAQTSGHSIIVSGGAVIASMAGLFIIGGATFNSLAASSILVVAIAVLGSITVLPALLVTLGRWVDRPRVPLLWRLNARLGQGGISRRVLAPVVRRPVAALVASGLVVCALAAPAFGLKMHVSGLDTLPDSIPAVRTMLAVQDEFPGEGPVAEVVATGDPEEVRAGLAALERAAAGRPDFAVVDGDSIRTSPDGRTAILTLAIPFEETADEVRDAVHTLREDLVPAHLDGVDEHAVGGLAASDEDTLNRMETYLPIVVGAVLLLTTVMMGISFRSVPIALVSTALNLASVGVAFGVMALVFQRGVGESLLGFESSGYVVEWLPMLVMVILVGLSMDYHVFVLGRVRELVASGLPTRLAVARGISDTAGVVTSAAAVMVSVFSIFAVLSLIEMKTMGVGLAVAILVDATLIRLVALPAILILLGERAWWPNRPDRPVGEVIEERAVVAVG